MHFVDKWCQFICRSTTVFTWDYLVNWLQTTKPPKVVALWGDQYPQEQALEILLEKTTTAPMTMVFWTNVCQKIVSMKESPPTIYVHWWSTVHNLVGAGAGATSDGESMDAPANLLKTFADSQGQMQLIGVTRAFVTIALTTASCGQGTKPTVSFRLFHQAIAPRYEKHLNVKYAFRSHVYSFCNY